MSASNESVSRDLRGPRLSSDEESVDALRRRAEWWKQRLSVRPRAVRVQSMRRKWGSCSNRGVVTLSVELASCEKRVQDLVILHEMLHLRVRSHGKVFKTLMSAYMPRWRAVWAELNSQAPTVVAKISLDK